MNFRKDSIGNPLNTIDTFEILAIIIMVSDGVSNKLIDNIIYIFGFENGEKGLINKEEFYFFLDSLFRGFNALIIPPEVANTEIEILKYQKK